MHKRTAMTFSTRAWLALLALCWSLAAAPALARDQPWDQNHDFTQEDNPDPPGPCEGAHCDPCTSTGSPVYIPTGHFIWTETDASLPGRPGLSLTRTYNSHDPRLGQFGNGWTADCGIRLIKTVASEVDAEGNRVRRPSVAFVASNGKRHSYRQGSGGSYVSASGRTETIRDSSAGGLTLTTQGGFVHEFDSAGRMVRRAEPSGRRTDYTYTDDGQLARMADGNGRYLDFAYNARGLTESVTDHAGRVWSYEYDDDANLIAVTDPGGGITRYEYVAETPANENFTYYQLSRIIDPTDVVITEVTYNGTQVASYTSGSNTFTYSYNRANRQVTKTDSQNSRWQFVYDENQLITQRTDPLGAVQRYTYDGAGNLTAYVDANGNTWSAEFDDQKRKLKDISPLGHTTEYSYGTDFPFATLVKTPSGRQLVTELNAQGNIVRAVNGEGDAVTMQWTEGGDLTSATDPLGNSRALQYSPLGLVRESADALGNRATFTFDEVGRVATITNEAGDVLTLTHDVLDRVVAVRDPSGATTRYTYDAAGRTLSMTDPAGQTTTYAYDEFGRLLSRTYPDGRTISVTYRQDNLPADITRADGSRTVYTYNAGKLVTREVSGDVTTNYTYSPRLELLTIANGSGRITYTYDADGRLIAEDQGGALLEYSYNAESERIATTYNGRTLQYERNANGWITKVIAPEGEYEFEYDAVGNRTALTRPNGTREVATFDKANKLTELRHEGAFSETYAYSYDAANNISRMQTATGQWHYSYNSDAQLIAAEGDEQSFTYPVDAAGNITLDGRVYDNNHRLIESATHSFEYDQRGNLIRKTDKDTQAYTLFAWNGDNRLVRVQRFADDVATRPATEVSYTYDPLGRRWSRTANGVTERYVYDGGNIIATLGPGGAAAAVYTFGPGLDQPLSADFGGERRYFHADHLGSIVALTDGAGVTDRYRYGPFGETLGATGDSPNPFRYTAREYEADDLYYYRNRYYDPTVQRFLSEDRMGFAGGDHNLYRYTGNNPANFTDPTGNWAFLIPVIWAGVEIALAVYDTYDTYQTITDPCLGTSEKLVAGGLFLAGFILPGGGYSKADDAVRGLDDLADAARRNPCGCFAAGTEVATPDGPKPIEELREGDLVLAKDETSMEMAYKPVTDLLRYEEREFYELAVATAAGIDSVLVTDDHPIWLISDGWVKVGDVEPGAFLLTADGDSAELIIKRAAGRGKAFNLEVQGLHTYFVGEIGLWVHNCPTQILQRGGNKINKNTANELNRNLGENLHSRDWGRALESLKRDLGLRNDHHGGIRANGDYIDDAGNVLGNLSDYLP